MLLIYLLLIPNRLTRQTGGVIASHNRFALKTSQNDMRIVSNSFI